jgi:hypothetical protein
VATEGNFRPTDCAGSVRLSEIARFKRLIFRRRI